jgi:hypothetical protein
MQRFKSRDQAQDFLSAHAITYGHFRLRRHRLSAVGYRRARKHSDLAAEDVCPAGGIRLGTPASSAQIYSAIG